MTHASTTAVSRGRVRDRLRWLAGLAALLGLGLLALNLVGALSVNRAPSVDAYEDFAGSVTAPFAQSWSLLEQLKANPPPEPELVTAATRIFHDGIAHVSPGDRKARGLDYYGIRIAPQENWILYLATYVLPETYGDYEFCSYRRALERGTGRCGQQSLALVSFLSELGLETGFVALDGHAIATARVGPDEWYLLDPDYGGVIPFGIDRAEADPASVLPHYWSDAARRNEIHELYRGPNRVKYGDASARYPRACTVETVAYVLKWVIPAALAVFGLAALFRPSRRRR